MFSNESTDYINEGRQYFKTARNGRKRKQVFTNELTYNLIGLSVEKSLIGLCLQQGHVPEDHTITGIVRAVHELFPMEPSLMKEIQMMDKIQNMCSLDVNNLYDVSDPQINDLLLLNERVITFVDLNVAKNPSA
jgi:HEPN domain-containing protein